MALTQDELNRIHEEEGSRPMIRDGHQGEHFAKVCLIVLFVFAIAWWTSSSTNGTKESSKANERGAETQASLAKNESKAEEAKKLLAEHLASDEDFQISHKLATLDGWLGKSAEEDLVTVHRYRTHLTRCSAISNRPSSQIREAVVNARASFDGTIAGTKSHYEFLSLLDKVLHKVSSPASTSLSEIFDTVPRVPIDQAPASKVEPPQEPPSKRALKLGETATVGGMSYKAWRVTWSKILHPNRYLDAPSDATYLIVRIVVQNLGNRPQSIPPFTLVDSKGREHSTTQKARLVETSFKWFDELNPDVKKDGVAVFDVVRQPGYKLKVAGGPLTSQYALFDLDSRPGNAANAK